MVYAQSKTVNIIQRWDFNTKKNYEPYINIINEYSNCVMSLDSCHS